MRIAHVMTLIGAAALSLSAAAEPASTAASASIATVNVAQSVQKLNPWDVKAVVGTYALDDGRTLRVSTEHRKLYAEVDGVKTELVAVGGKRFASIDDKLHLTFDTTQSVANDVTLSTLAAR